MLYNFIVEKSGHLGDDNTLSLYHVDLLLLTTNNSGNNFNNLCFIDLTYLFENVSIQVGNNFLNTTY